MRRPYLRAAAAEARATGGTPPALIPRDLPTSAGPRLGLITTIATPAPREMKNTYSQIESVTRDVGRWSAKMKTHANNSESNA